MMKRWGILCILLFVLSGCSALPAQGDVFATLTESDRYFMEGSDFRIVLTDLSLQEIENFYRAKYPSRFTLDSKSTNALFFTIRADGYYQFAVTPNDLGGDQAYAILITEAED